MNEVEGTKSVKNTTNCHGPAIFLSFPLSFSLYLTLAISISIWGQLDDAIKDESNRPGDKRVGGKRPIHLHRKQKKKRAVSSPDKPPHQTHPRFLTTHCLPQVVDPQPPTKDTPSSIHFLSNPFSFLPNSTRSKIT